MRPVIRSFIWFNLIWFKSEEIGEGVESITFNELLDVVHTDTVIVKMDIQGAECKVFYIFLGSNKFS